MTNEEVLELATWKNHNNGLAFRKINPEVAYLKIPTFYNNDDRIGQLVASNDSIIRNTKYLIVDLSGNSGGNTGWIYVLPYFMTNPIIQQSSLLRVTPDNIKLKLADLEPFVKNPIGEEYKKYFPDSVLNAYKKAYEELPTTKELFYPIPAVVFPLDSISKKPEKIALVMDNFCGSASEYFFYLSKQSKKTISYGTNTIGMMDYEGMSSPTHLPFDKFILTIPIAKSSWTDTKPIDQTGFKPDVSIDLPQSKWIDFIIKDLQSR
jgi:C-terminal processing protease CtpA/Prc